MQWFSAGFGLANRIFPAPEPGVFRKRITFAEFYWRDTVSGEKGQNSQQNRPVTDEAIFKVTKEIVVKFIEVGRLTPANFAETYEQIYTTVKRSVYPE